ncbi:MAG: tail fiber domain-containing protein, partial [Verrucomicrobia bacterium]|nr:tail fiber domain-containing protein [Verrucomicrobiota bacterium]
AATITSASLDPSLGVWSRSGMNLFYSGGNVGIGTANPTKVLHVVGNVTVEGAETVELRANRVALGYSTVGGFYSTAMGSSIAVGDLSTAMGLSTASKYSSTAMGWSMATGSYSTAMGVSTASKSMSTAMGWATADGDISTAMGSSTASGNLSTAMGDSTASGNYSTAMGYLTIAGGQYSLAAGNQAKANHDGSFVWADFQNPEFASTSSNQFLIRASGGVGINTTNPASALHVQTPANVDSAVRLVSGGSWPLVLNQSPASLFSITNGGQARLVIEPGGNVGIGTQNPATALHVIGTVTATTFNPPSDRNLKENLTPISPGAVLDKVAAMPITRWNFKGDAVTPHLGPMAQDFYAPFGLGTDDKHIATVDADGVALAAIQGLNEKVEVRSQKSEVSIQELQAENAELKRRLEKLERLLSQEKGGAR